jgi:hypothetical protein
MYVVESQERAAKKQVNRYMDVARGVGNEVSSWELKQTEKCSSSEKESRKASSFGSGKMRKRKV